MRLKSAAFALLVATALTGCNDTLDSARVDISKVKNKVEHPLSGRLIAEMKKRDMPRNSPIMIRIYKEEGVLEVWKAKANNRFDVVTSYQICAWSGKLGPKVKEGDRQAPEGFYNLTPGHMNPNSQYYLAINTGFPNRYDQANGRSGSNLMIHGACSSSGCYSMTDEQIIEIYALAREAFRGGQKSIQLQALPFRMTAENMARHRNSPHHDFWKMLKVGYDHFEVTKRPPQVDVCGRQYVFNQEAGGNRLAAASACPPMSTPPALAEALSSHNKRYDVAYGEALEKLGGKVWYEPSEAERKAVVAAQRKGRELAYAPTGTSLAAGRLMSESEFKRMMESRTGSRQGTAPASSMAPVAAPAGTAARPATAAERMREEVPATTASVASSAANAPVPAANPQATAAQAVEQAAETPQKRPFWKLWGSQ